MKDVKGTENIPKKGPYIITANHESQIVGIFTSLKRLDEKLKKGKTGGV